MSTLTIGLAEAKNNFSRLTAHINETGQAVTVMKNNRPWVVITPAHDAATRHNKALDVAVDFMEEYADVFTELAQ